MPDAEVDHRSLAQQIGGIVLGSSNVTVTAAAAALAVSVDEVRAALPGLTVALAACGMTLTQRGDALRITPYAQHAIAALNTEPMNVNEARLLRRVESGQDVRRRLTKTERELALPSLARRGLLDITRRVPAATAAVDNRVPKDSAS